MSDIGHLNLFALRAMLRRLGDQMDTTAKDGLQVVGLADFEALEKYKPVFDAMPQGHEFFESLRQKSLRPPGVWGMGPTGDLRHTLQTAILPQLEAMVPFPLILLRDETERYPDDMREALGWVHAAYLVDANRTTPEEDGLSMYYLYSTTSELEPIPADLLVRAEALMPEKFAVARITHEQLRDWPLHMVHYCEPLADADSAQDWPELMRNHGERLIAQTPISAPRTPTQEMLAHLMRNALIRGDGERLGKLVATAVASGDRGEGTARVQRLQQAMYESGAAEGVADLLRTFVGALDWRPQFPQNFNVNSRRAVVSDLQGGLTVGAGRISLASMLSLESRLEMMKTRDRRYGTHGPSFMVEQGALSASSATPLFRDVQATQPTLAAAWEHGVEDVFVAYSRLQNLCEEGMRAEIGAWKNSVHRKAMDITVHLIEEYACYLAALTEAPRGDRSKRQLRPGQPQSFWTVMYVQMETAIGQVDKLIKGMGGDIPKDSLLAHLDDCLRTTWDEMQLPDRRNPYPTTRARSAEASPAP